MDKQIEEMAKIIGENSWEGITRPECYVCAEALYNAGYRDEKETARKILQEIGTVIKAIGNDYNLSGNQTLSMLCTNIYNKVFDKLAEKHCTEVE